jgi:hypothetical protein
MCAKQQEVSELSSLAPKRAGKQPSAARSDGKNRGKRHCAQFLSVGNFLLGINGFGPHRSACAQSFPQKM